MENYSLFGSTQNKTFNRTTESLHTLCHVKEHYMYILTGTLILLSVAGTVENSLVLIAMCRFRKLRNRTTVLIGALATIDLLTSAIVIPLYVVQTLDPSVPWYKANIILMTIVVTLSLLTAVYISVDRFLQVYHLQNYNMTTKRSAANIFIVWIVTFVVFSLIRGLVTRIHGREAGKVAGRIIAAILLTFCISVIVAAYLGILVLLRRHAKKMENTLQSDYLSSQSRASKTSLIIVICVLVMNFPTLIYTSISSTGLRTPTWFCAITLVTLLGSSTLNPLVYCLLISTIKERIFFLIGCKGENNRKEHDEVANVRFRAMSQSPLIGEDAYRLTVCEHHLFDQHQL